GLIVGLAAGALLGVILYRFSMAVGLGLVLGVAAPLTVAAMMSFRADRADPGAHRAEGTGARQLGEASKEPDGDADTDRLPAKLTEEMIRRQLDNLKKQLNGDGTDAKPAQEGEPKPTPSDTEALQSMMRSAGERVQAFANAVGQDIA